MKILSVTLIFLPLWCGVVTAFGKSGKPADSRTSPSHESLDALRSEILVGTAQMKGFDDQTREMNERLRELSERAEVLEKLILSLNKQSQELSNAPKRPGAEVPQRSQASELPSTPKAISQNMESPEDVPKKISGNESDPVVVQEELSEKKLGDYYVLPFAGVLLPSATSYAGFGGKAVVRGDAGYNLGISGGKRFGNWSAGAALGFAHNDFNSIKGIPFVGTLDGSGRARLLYFSGRMMYAVSLSEKLSLNMGGGLGYGYRDDLLTVKVLPGTITVDSSGSVFSYEGVLQMVCDFSMNFHGLIAYRYLGATRNGSFGSYGAHLVELGLGRSF